MNNALSESQRGLIEAKRLSDHLHRGGHLEELASPIPLFAGEALFSKVPFAVSEFSGRDAYYNQTWVGVGTPLMFAATLGVSAMANQARKRRARAEAAPQWRQLNQGVLYMTNQRLAMQGALGWWDVHLGSIRNSDVVPGDGMVLFLDGSNPMKVSMPWPEWHFVLFHYLAYGRVLPIDLPAEVAPHAPTREPHSNRELPPSPA